MMFILLLVLALSACAGAPQRGSEGLKAPRIVEEDITTEAPSSADVPHSSSDVGISAPSAQSPQEAPLTPVGPGQRPPRRIIWRDQPAPERNQR